MHVMFGLSLFGLEVKCPCDPSLLEFLKVQSCHPKLHFFAIGAAACFGLALPLVVNDFLSICVVLL